jgi:hypothetical protein
MFWQSLILWSVLTFTATAYSNTRKSLPQLDLSPVRKYRSKNVRQPFEGFAILTPIGDKSHKMQEIPRLTGSLSGGRIQTS